MNKRICKEDQIKLIMECRRSGLSDYQWCEQNGIHAGTFYNWVSKLKKSGYTFPESESRLTGVPAVQEVVKVDLVSYDRTSSPIMEQNTTIPASADTATVAAELLIGNLTLRFYNGADEQLIQNTLQCIGGMDHDR